jgi:glycine oxidase
MRSDPILTDPSQINPMQVNVIGAGVAGLSVATELRARGAEVRIIEQHEGPGPHACSWWAGGMLAPWCERESAEEAVVTHGAAAIDWWDTNAGGVTRNGSLVVAPPRDRNELKRFARRTRDFATVNGDQIAELEPSLEGRFGRGLFFAGEAHLTPRIAVATLARRLRDNGAQFLGGTVGSQAPTADITVDCRGLAARDALPDLRGVKGEMLILRCPEMTLSRPVRLLHPRIPLYIVPRGEGVFMVGATMIESDERTRITARSLLELLGAAYALHPAFGEAEVLEIGVDARPAFADNLPRIRRHGQTLFANGLYRHGFLLAPALARMTAQAALDGTHVPEWMDENLL